mmetsp:Transcript_5157/g.12918  ORF Transcript_5157/g.12918 Transcript_5157/m.12918 type:complete len:336 (+) Transcript_5157:67-1074(+)
MLLRKVVSVIPPLLAILASSSSHVQVAASPIVVGAEEEEGHHQRSLRGLGALIDPKTILHKTPPEPALATDAEACCVPCTSPVDVCCLKCSDVSPYREHDLLMASMEGLTTHLMDKHAGQHDFLKNRSWEGNSHIGNRPLQATYYYDWIRSLDNVRHVCEIGLNGGHSAVIFLASLAGREDVKLTMFDLMMWQYSPTAAEYVNALYPGKMQVFPGNSRHEVPKWAAANPNDKCDVFSVDGGHRYFEAYADIINAAKATKKGGVILLDDMTRGGNTRKAFDDAVDQGVLENPHCVENVAQKVGYVNRVDESNARQSVLSWCMATVKDGNIEKPYEK